MENKKKYRVLVVDNTISDIETLMELLQKDYMVIAATNGERALTLANKQPQPDMILLDVDMPTMNGFEVCRQLKQNPITSQIPVVFMYSENGVDADHSGLELGAMDYLTKPLIPSLVRLRVKNCLELVHSKSDISNGVVDVTTKSGKTQAKQFEILDKLLESRGVTASLRINKIQLYVKTLAESLLASSKGKQRRDLSTIEQLYQCAPLYCINRLVLSDDAAISLNEGDNSKVELYTALVQEVGSSIKTDSIIKIAKEMLNSRHERWDGSGYPKGLKGEAIPISSRVMAIADVYDELVSHQGYRDPFTHQEAVKIIENSAGTHFDPELVNVFINVEPLLLEIALLDADHHEERDARQAATASHPSRSAQRILVVEDNDLMRAVVQSQFENLDFEVTTAAHGEAALDLINQPGFYDFIITDINMPVMNGYELLEAIQKKGNSIPVVAMTASDLELTQQKAIELGFAACLLKPFDENDIFQLIDMVSGIK